MKKILFCMAAFILMANVQNLSAWGQKGHDIVAYIAEKNLKCKAKKRVTKILEGHTMMYYSSWMDNIRDFPEYAGTKTWHYANVDEGETYETMKKEANGDVYTALTTIVEKLHDKRNLTDSLENLYVKFLIHLVGDLHCPMHAGRLSDLGGNRLKIKWFNTPTNIHSVWDSSFIESARKWSYTEWQKNIDNFTKKELKAVAEGTPLDWLNETVDICKILYMGVVEDENYSWAYMYDNFPVLESQLRKAGYRLASILNSIYG